MPEVSRFFGIVVTMYAEAGERHNTPHFHIRYGGQRATFSIEGGDLLAGALPRAQMRLVQAWIELHRSELENNWRLLITGDAPNKIQPLQ